MLFCYREHYLNFVEWLNPDPKNAWAYKFVNNFVNMNIEVNL